MAILKSLALVNSIALAVITQGCSLVDPLIASGEYSVETEGKGKVEVKLIGGKEVSRLRQRDVIQDYMLDLSADTDRVSAAFDAMLEIEELFGQNGYPLAQVAHEIEPMAGGLKVRFRITPGPRITVESVDITGNQAISKKELLRFWSRQQTEALGFGDDLYVADQLEALATGIQGLYRRRGFLDARAVLDSVEPPLAESVESVRVSVKVTEGACYKISEIKTAKPLAEALSNTTEPGPKAGDTFVPDEVRDHVTGLAQKLRGIGYHRPVVRTTIIPNRENHRVAIEIHGEPGPRVKVAKIEIEGEGFVSEGHIRQRISLLDGELFDGRREEESVLRLYQTGLFRKIDVEHRPAGIGQDEVDVVFDVEETTRYSIEPMIGWGSYEELRAGLEFEMLSVFGTGFDLNTKGTISDKGHRVVAAVSNSQFWPSLLGYRTTFSVAADTFRREEPSFVDGAVGVSPSLSHSFTTHFSARVAYILREHNDTESDVIHASAQLGDYTEGSAVLELTFDDRDNPSMPSAGSRVSVQYKYYDDALGGDVEFERLRVGGSTILPLAESLRFVLRGEASVLFPGTTADAIPIQEKLFNGGENSVRSFREDQLAEPALKDINGQPIGGSFRNVFNAEFRWTPPLQPLRALKTELALFGDAGNVGGSANSYGIQDMRYAVGIGLRLLLPIGPVRFDAAYNPDAVVTERDWTFHFSIGYPF